MASAPIVITEGDIATAAIDGIFAGLSFFLVQRLPSRNSYVERIQTNGGRVVRLEGQADHVIADHYRQDCPPGSISYTFIESALKNGELPDPADHHAGPPPGTVRAAGSGVPGKNTRTAFTAEDDRVLYQWVERARRDGGRVKGNEIYKQLEAVNPRHTFQAWRDRYVKKLMDNPPAGVGLAVTVNAPPSPPRAQDAEDEISEPNVQPVTTSKETNESTETAEAIEVEDEPDEIVSLPKDDVEALLIFAEDIEMIAEDQVVDAWNQFAKDFGRHTAGEWHRIWLDQARPVYLARDAEQGDAQHEEMARDEVEAFDDTNERVLRPSSSPKRKRGSKSPEKVYGRKKLKHDANEIFGEQDEEVAAPEQSAEARPIAVDTAAAVPTTSDLNAEAQAQFDEEVLGVPRADATLNAAVPHDFPASDLNQAAEQQLQREALELAGFPTVSGQALTEANLASQQAEHMDISRRGHDIPADGDESDGERQNQFVECLQDLTGRSGQLQNANIDQIDLPSVTREPRSFPNVNDTVIGAPQGAFATGFHFSSEAVVEDVLNDELINWPNSPQQDRPAEATVKSPRFSQFETQVVYPSLPTHVREDQPGELGAAETPIYPDLTQRPTASASRGNPDLSQVYPQSSQIVDEEDELEYSVPRPAGAPISSGVQQQDAEEISSDSSSNKSDAEAPAAQNERSHKRQQHRRAVETQDIVNAETQMPDFKMPLPPDSDDGSDELASDPLEPRSSPPSHASKHLESQQKLSNTQTLADNDELDEYIETMKVRNFEQASIINALKATSMRPDLAELVLLEEKAGKGFPDDVPGVWSAEEDRMVEGGNANAIKTLEAKHGWEECEARLEFLSEYRDDDDDDGEEV